MKSHLYHKTWESTVSNVQISSHRANNAINAIKGTWALRCDSCRHLQCKLPFWWSQFVPLPLQLLQRRGGSQLTGWALWRPTVTWSSCSTLGLGSLRSNAILCRPHWGHVCHPAVVAVKEGVNQRAPCLKTWQRRGGGGFFCCCLSTGCWCGCCCCSLRARCGC